MSNTERLELMAAACESVARMQRELLSRPSPLGTIHLFLQPADQYDRDAAFLRSLIPLVEAGERAQKPSETFVEFVQRVDRERLERQANCPHLRDDWRSFEEPGDWSLGWCCKCGKHMTQPLPAPPKEGA